MTSFFGMLVKSVPIATSLLAAAVALPLFAPASARAVELSGVTIGSGPVGADFFVLDTSLKQLMGKKFPNARIENTSTSGSVENFRLLRNGDIDVGIFATTAMSDDDAIAFVKALYENLGELAVLQLAVGEALNDPGTLTAKTTPYPYHPGAIKFWKEVGRWKD